jgi:hypothetical protein
MTFDFIRVSELLKSCQMDGIKKSTQFFSEEKIVVDSIFPNRRRLNFSESCGSTLNFSESSAVICVSSAL